MARRHRFAAHLDPPGAGAHPRGRANTPYL